MLTLNKKANHYLIKIADEANKNRITDVFLDSFIEIIKKIEKEKEHKIVILTGSNKYFCTGVDFTYFEGKSNFSKYIKQAQKILSWLATSNFLTVSIINGYANGLGFELAMACDLSISVDKTKFSMPQLHYGVFPDYLAFLAILKGINRNRLNSFYYLNKTIKAQEAKEIGLITDISNSPMEHIKNLLDNHVAINTIVIDKRISTNLFKKLETTAAKNILNKQKRHLDNLISRNSKTFS